MVVSVSDQILASPTSTSVSDSPAPLHQAGVDQSLTAVSAPGPQSPNEQTPAAILATLLQRPETGSAPQQQTTNRDLSPAEGIPSRTRVNPFEDAPQPQRQTTEEFSAECLPSRTPVNLLEEIPQGQTLPAQSLTPSSRSKTTSKAAKKTTTELQPGAKSVYKPRVTLARGADPSLRKGPDDSLLL